MPEDVPMISSKSREILARVKRIVPPMLEKFHKGQLGRVAVIGGSQDYTGAPFFSASASARLGADMSHVICELAAGQVIKTYSPNLMVHPLMRQSGKPYNESGGGSGSNNNNANDNKDNSSSTNPDAAADDIIAMLGRLHALVIGPGLGRDKAMQATSRAVLVAARDRGIPVVLDADALLLVNDDPDLVRGCKTVVLTPNVVEFARLAKAVGVELGGDGAGDGGSGTGNAAAAAAAASRDCERVSRALGGVVVVQKGRVDYISDGSSTLVCDLQGGRKRSGGQGDTLTGCAVTMLAWRKAYHDRLWEEGEKDDDGDDSRLSEAETLLLAAFGGAAITRECSRLAFRKLGRAMQASDVGDMVPAAFENLIGEKDPHPSKI